MDSRSAAKRQENRVAVALAAREAMREHRKGKPIAFSWWQPHAGQFGSPSPWTVKS